MKDSDGVCVVYDGGIIIGAWVLLGDVMWVVSFVVEAVILG